MLVLVRRLAAPALLAGGVLAVGLVTFLPRITEAEEVLDADRAGEPTEDGDRFGDVVVRGELVAAQGAPGGWSLVRTVENVGEAAATVDLEERIVRIDSETMARVGSAPVTVLSRTQHLRLGPGEKRVLGTSVGAKLGAEMTAAARTRDAVLHETTPRRVTLHEYRADYLRALQPGETAARPEPRPGLPPPRMADFDPAAPPGFLPAAARGKE